MNIPITAERTTIEPDKEFRYLKDNNVLQGFDPEQIATLLLRLERQKLGDVVYLISDFLDRQKYRTMPDTETDFGGEQPGGEVKP